MFVELVLAVFTWSSDPPKNLLKGPVGTIVSISFGCSHVNAKMTTAPYKAPSGPHQPSFHSRRFKSACTSQEIFEAIKAFPNSS